MSARRHPRSRPPQRPPLNAEEMVAARAALDALPLIMSEAAQRERARQQARVLVPTAYTYVVPQVKSTLCNLCEMTDDHTMSGLFVGHDHPNNAHRHFMCSEHYIANRDAGGTCPSCREPMGEWPRNHRKVVNTLANGTEVVTHQGIAPAAAHAGGKKRNRTGRHYKRARATRRRQSSKKQK